MSGGMIYVTGRRARAVMDGTGSGVIEYSPVEQFPTLNPVDTESGGGGAWMDPPRLTDCVTASPAGHSLEDINIAALVATNQIAARDDASYEYGVIIYSLNGVIGWTRPVTQHQPGEIDWNPVVDEVPAGAIILATVHNHPNQTHEDDNIASENDWLVYDAMQEWNGERGITVDPNMLMYLYTDEDFKTRVYDKHAHGSQDERCYLQSSLT